jgi:hypothetical protein
VALPLLRPSPELFFVAGAGAPPFPFAILFLPIRRRYRG